MLDICSNMCGEYRLSWELIAFWFSWPRSRLSANCRICCAVRVSMRSSLCMSVFVMKPIKMSFMRSSSADPRRHFAPRALRRQRKLSSFSFCFCLQVKRRKRSYVMLRGCVKERASSCANSNTVNRSISEWGNRCW